MFSSFRAIDELPFIVEMAMDVGRKCRVSVDHAQQAAYPVMFFVHICWILIICHYCLEACLGLAKVFDVMTALPDPQTIIDSIGLPGDPASTRIVVAMSGGVDSSVVAGLLKHAGYDVVGVTLQLYDHGDAMHRSGSCCSGQDIQDARRVADILGFPHYVLDYETRFREAVMDSFADSYVSGETPVPCIACNQKIKFKDMLATAKDLGAAALATGHYVMSRPSRDPGTTHREMYQAADLSKDQSYFLFATTHEQLDYLRFPLGALEKSETRQLALAMGLPVADKSDSQDICFVPTGHYADVVEKLRPGAAEPGEIVHIDGRILGTHGGIVNFTIGQRRGIGIALGDPLYVVRLDANTRQVVVGPRDALFSSHIKLRDVNWLGSQTLAALAVNNSDDARRVYVRVRSSRKPQPARLHIWGDAETGFEFSVELDDGEEGIAPGQACVMYSSDQGPARVLGGGWIESVDSDRINGNRLPKADREPWEKFVLGAA